MGKKTAIENIDEKSNKNTVINQKIKFKLKNINKKAANNKKQNWKKKNNTD